MKKEKIDRHIERLFACLKKLRNKNGSWGDNNFINALVACSLFSLTETQRIGQTERRTFDSMLKKSTAFIFTQKNEGWSWNYYARIQSSTCPDDLDDTFCSLIAIFKIQPRKINQSGLMHIAELLMNTETKEGGPYRTWVGVNGAENNWNDVDIVVNASIAYFVSLTGAPLPNTRKYIDRRISTGDMSSRYYHNPLIVFYFLSRGYCGEKRDKLIELIYSEIRRKTTGNGKKMSCVETAFIVCALVRLGVSPSNIKNFVDDLRHFINRTPKNIKTVDAITTEPLYIEKIKNGVPCYARSASWGIAVIIEALSLYAQANDAMLAEHDRIRAEQKEKRELKNISRRAEKRCSSLPRDIRIEALRMIHETTTKGSRILHILPYQLVTARRKKIGNYVVDCEMISLYGWMAYSIYDRILDGKEKPWRLSLANIFQREMTTLVTKYTSKERTAYQNILDGLDVAGFREYARNQIENRNTKTGKDSVPPIPSLSPLPSKRSIISRSIGLMVPSLIALTCSGVPAHSSSIKKFTEFFEHYLFIKQMSDDMRDWQEDIELGIITRVTARIHTKRTNKDQDAEKSALIASAKEIVRCVRLAKKAILSSGLFTNPLFLIRLIEACEQPAKKIIYFPTAPFSHPHSQLQVPPESQPQKPNDRSP